MFQTAFVPFMIGKTVYGYTLLRKIADGGMSEVYYAETKLHQPVAVKILKEYLSKEDGIRLRFQQEAEVMAGLNHPYVCKVYDYAEIDHCPAIIMEYLEGKTLKQILEEQGSLNSTTAALYWNSLVEALNYTHQKGAVHRDIKPGNIFVTNKGTVKLLDFGIAKIKDSLTGTQTGTKMGTLVYMSPEQLADSKHIDYRTDSYSLAVTFVHLLSGKMPYDTKEISEFFIMKKIYEEPLDMTGVPSEWQSFLTPFLAKDPTKRPLLKAFSSIADAPLSTDTVIEVSQASMPKAPIPPKTAKKKDVAKIFLAIVSMAIFILLVMALMDGLSLAHFFD